jgi:multiple sugar transport system substrate-binding protein
MRTARLRHLGVAFALLAAVACGEDATESTDNGSTDTGTEETSGSTPSASEPASGGEPSGDSLRVWGWASSETEDAAFSTLLGEYSATAGTKITFEPQPEYDTALNAALSAGDPPNFFYVDSMKVPDLVDAGALTPIPDGAITEPDDIYPALKDAFTVDGTWYCPPKDFSTLGLIYDPAAFEEAGIEPPTTMDELAAAAEALTTDDRKGLIFGPELARAGVFMLANGGYIVNDDVTEMTLDSDANRSALQFIVDMFANGSTAKPSDVEAGWAGEAFGQGKAAMVIEGNWVASYLAENFPDREFAVAEIPAGSAGRATFAFTVCYGVGAQSDNADAAWKAVDYLTGPEGAKKWTDNFNVMPARPSLRDGWIAGKPELEAFVAGAEYAQPWQFKPGFADVVTEFNAQFESLIAGDTTVDDLISSVTSAGESVLE